MNNSQLIMLGIDISLLAIVFALYFIGIFNQPQLIATLVGVYLGVTLWYASNYTFPEP